MPSTLSLFTKAAIAAGLALALLLALRQVDQRGYDRAMASLDPDCIVPVDELRKLEKEGVFKKLHPVFYTTTGTGTSVNNAEKFGQEIGEILRKAEVSAAKRPSPSQGPQPPRPKGRFRRPRARRSWRSP